MVNEAIYLVPSEFKDLQGIEYFDFEEEFIEKNMRCIPMIVRFKMDETGIKLKLKEWSRFNTEERIQLALKPCSSPVEKMNYHNYLTGLVNQYMDYPATQIQIDRQPLWGDLSIVPRVLTEKALEYDFEFGLAHWRGLTDLQRFTLLKLCRQGHENRNFPKAMREFGFTLTK